MIIRPEDITRGMPVLAFAGCFVMLFLSCQGSEDINSLRQNTNSILKIALTPEPNGQHAMFASAPTAAGTVGICKFLPTQKDVCNPQHAAFKPLQDIRSAGDLKIMKYPEPIDLSKEFVYIGIDKDAKVIRSYKFGKAPTPPPGQPGSININPALALINEAKLREELTFLTRDEWQGRLAGSPHNNAAADWIIGQLRSLNVEPGINGNFKQPFMFSSPQVGAVNTNNIVGVIRGADPQLRDEYIVIGAHMDHTGTLTRGFTCDKGDSASNNICNGADDNGSGTIGLLNIVKALSQIRGQLKRSVIVIWFSAEEEGLKGSYHYVDNPNVDLRKIKLMINLDMIGYLRQNNNRLMAIGTDNQKPAYKVAERIASKYQNLTLVGAATAKGGSDHAPFMGKGIPAIFFHTGVTSNPNYHKTSDTPDKIDYAGMAVTSKIALETLVTMANQPGNAGFGLTSDGPRQSLLPPSELDKSCHHLIFIEEDIMSQMDFTNGNDGGFKNAKTASK